VFKEEGEAVGEKEEEEEEKEKEEEEEEEEERNPTKSEAGPRTKKQA
jgi:hypothetical protein